MTSPGVDPAAIHLVVVLLRGSRLTDATERWGFHQADLYRRLAPRLGSVSWVSFGGRNDRSVEGILGGVTVLSNRWGLSPMAYREQLPWLHRDAFSRATIVKAEQVLAGREAARIARHLGVPFICRSGYLPSDLARDEASPNLAQIEAIEDQVLAEADAIVVGSEAERTRLSARRADLPDELLRVIPNYVNVDIFHPDPHVKPAMPPVVVGAGRFVHQKNFGALISAVSRMPEIGLRLIGEGELEPDYRRQIHEQGLTNVELVGAKSPTELADEFCRATLVVQPSHYEGGHAKTVIEAMACGAPVIGADVAGIANVVKNDETGLLSSTDPDSLAKAIGSLLADARRRTRLAEQGRAFVANTLSLDRIAEDEIALLQQVAGLAGLPVVREKRRRLHALELTAKWYAGRLVKPKDR